MRTLFSMRFLFERVIILREMALSPMITVMNIKIVLQLEGTRHESYSIRARPLVSFENHSN